MTRFLKQLFCRHQWETLTKHKTWRDENNRRRQMVEEVCGKCGRIRAVKK